MNRVLVYGLVLIAISTCLGEESNDEENDDLTPEFVQLRTKYGELKGTVLTSTHGKKIYSFRGIPYAKPPVGELRFELPQPADPWTGVFDASSDGSTCPQALINNPSHIIGNEDCLILNVYTPVLQETEGSKAEKLPVLFFIHGGGFYSGSSMSLLHGPRKFLDKNVVLVTINYRLGPLGFLSSGDEVIRGNFGMQDQILALKWVQNNIESFGGDKFRVTAFGHSAGSASVLYHVISPASKGLFNNAIAMAGSPSSDWAFRTNSANTLQRFASQLNCPTSENTQLLSCLRATNASDFVRADVQLKNGHIMQVLVAPVVETHSQENKFLSETVDSLLKSGKFNTDNMIIGQNSEEGSAFYEKLEQMFNNKKGLNTEQQFTNLLHILQTNLTNLPKNKMEAIVQIVMEKYEITPTTNANELRKAFTYVTSDLVFTAGIEHFTQGLIRQGTHVWQYMFDHPEPAMSLFKTLYNMNTTGTAHGDELLYMFDTMFHNKKLTGAETQVSQNFLDLLTSFAAYNDPLPGNGETEWNPRTEKINSYLHIGPALKQINTPFRQNYSAFWQQLNEDFAVEENMKKTEL